MLSGNFLRGKMQKLALYDFCDTLVSFQTADAFVDYVRKRDGNLYMRFLNNILLACSKARVIAVLNKLFPGKSFSKKFKLLQLRGLKFETLDKRAESYYREMIKPNLIMPVISDMQEHAQQDYEVCIVSAGYSIYLKYFAEDYRLKHIISTEIAFEHHGERCLGTFSGRDCLHLEKVNRLKAYFSKQNVNFNESISYSDSKTDLPMLLLTGKGVVVSRAKTQSWRHQYKFKEIIWNLK